MTHRIAPAAAGLVAVFLVCSGCDASEVPVGPTPAPPAYSLAGVVTDTAFRPLGEVRVEIVAGPRAGTVVTTGGDGHFSFQGTFTDVTTLAASKGGYRSQEQTVSPDRVGSFGGERRAWAEFYLELPGPTADITGDYTLTVTAAAACNGLPPEAKARIYSATVAAGSRSGQFVASLGDARFFQDRFVIGTAGDFASVLLSTVEVLNERNHVLVDGVGRGSIESAGITASLEGWIVHCPSDLSLIDQGTFWCLDPARAQCYSDSHRLTLVRR